MTTPNDDIRSLIQQAASGSAPPSSARPQSSTSQSTAHQPSADEDDLQALIARSNPASRGPQGAPDSRKIHAPAQKADVKGAIARAFYATHVPKSLPTLNTARSRSAASAWADLSQAVLQAQALGDEPVTAATTSHKAKRLHLALMALAVVLLLAAGGLWWWTQNRLSGPAATLHDLAKSIEQYRHQNNGSLPEQLSELEFFPKDAVQWSLRHWQARDAAGRTEIFLVPNGPKHYRIVLRQGREVWLYSDLNGQTKQSKP